MIDIFKILHSIYFVLFSASLLYVTFTLVKFFWFYNLDEPKIVKLTTKESVILWICLTILFVSLIKGIII